MNTLILLPASECRIALAGLLKVAGKTHLPVSSFIRLTRDEAGTVTLQATDIDSQVSYRCKQLQPGASLELVLALEPLAHAVKNVKEQIGFVLDDEQVYLQSFIGSIPMEEPIKTLYPERWPVFVQLDEGFTLGPEFPTALKEALDCTGNDPGRVALSGALLDVSDPHAHYLVGTDGGHLYAANSFSCKLDQSIILPNSKFLHWSGFRENGDWQLAVWRRAGQKPSWVQFTSGRWSFLTKTIDDAYPSWRQVLPTTNRRTRVVLSARAKQCLLEAVPQMPGRQETQQPVNLAVRSDQLLLRGRTNLSEFWTELAVPGTTIVGDPTEVCIDRNHLIKALHMDLLHV